MKWFGSKCILLLFGCVLLSCTGKTEGIRIAVPDDLGGILGYYVVRDKNLPEVTFVEDVFPLMDCCSTTTEWAMSADRIDIAWLCPDAARTLVEKDGRFEMMGPALVNSHILVIREESAPKRIAYSHKREYQKALILRRFGVACEAIPVMPQALPYVFEKGSVDGVVIDVIKGLALKGKYLPLQGDGDVVTYVLVVRRDFRRSLKYSPILAALKDGAVELNDSEILEKVLGKYKAMSPMQVRQVMSLGVRFVPPQIQFRK